MPVAMPDNHETNQAAQDDLLSCLAFLTTHYGKARSPQSLRAGLAYDDRGMGPALFCDAATRAGLKTKIVRRKKIAGIDPALLPVVLIRNGKQAGVLTALADGKATLYEPQTGKTADHDLATLEQSFAGYVIYAHPDMTLKDPDQSGSNRNKEKHWFWSIAADNAGLYGRVVLAAILVNLFALVGPLFIMNVYDRVIPNNAIETGWVLAIGALTAYLFDFIIRTLRGYFIDAAGRRTDIIATQRIYDRLLDIRLAGKPPSSGAFANMLRDFESVRDFMSSATMVGLVDLPFSLFFLFIIYLIGGPIALMLGSLILIVIGFCMLLQWPLRHVIRRSAKSAEARHGLLVETIGGLETIKAIGADGRLRARYAAHVGESAALGQQARFLSGLGVNIATFLQMSATIIIILMGMYLVQDAVLTMGGLIACVILGGRAIAPVGQVANLVSRYHQARRALETLDRLMALPVERPADRTFLHRPALEGHLRFDHVSFSYPKTDRPVLNDISFDIKAGEKVGLIGRIGSGKSTVARLMMALYEPSQGALYADNTDYRQIDPADLRRNIAYIAQDVVLFRGSIRENIVIGKPEATEEEILRAAKNAGVHDFVSRHPMGYDAPVGERGEGLSGGQRQAIALARAMLMDPAIMICDEPTNAMDMQAEAAFTAHISEQIKNRTFVLITHRQHLLTLVDRLILLDQGAVVADGAREDIIAALGKGTITVNKDGS